MEVNEQKLLNIYQKLQKSRAELQKKTMKKSGKNTFSHYEYFELGDFLPQVNEIAQSNGLAPIFNYTTESATLTIIDTDKIEDTILFTTPVVASELKGCMPMQSVGAMQTYARRYLYVMAFEISENDIVNNAEVDEEAEFKKKKIDLVKVETIKTMIKKSNSDEKSFCKWAKVSKVEDIENKDFVMCADMLEKAIEKYEKAKKSNVLEGVI
ncbi:ERF family protein [Clostridium tagluense]|uniref:ERF family protein n=1 Tax=Clostridium tagluense TaxID=360422 RepID=UPI001C0DF615|nr:ERF family protein [Clostridium tagluense]MBU3126774.1 ERF family protein [Clostridium tagluense]